MHHKGIRLFYKCHVINHKGNLLLSSILREVGEGKLQVMISVQAQGEVKPLILRHNQLSITYMYWKCASLLQPSPWHCAPNARMRSEYGNKFCHPARPSVGHHGTDAGR